MGLIRGSAKLAIEPKSIIYFEVAEIPMKKMQENYDNCELLGAKTEAILKCKKPIEAEKNNDSQIKSNHVQGDIFYSECKSTNISQLQNLPEILVKKRMILNNLNPGMFNLMELAMTLRKSILRRYSEDK